MRALASVVAAFGLSFALAAPANALIVNLDFEDGISQGSSTSLSGLNTYLRNAFGSNNVSAGDARWFGSSNTFGSDAIFSRGYSSTLNFDTLSRNASSFEITAISFDWGVFDATSGRDFGLDVYDDAIGGYRNNVFEVSNASDGDTGSSPLITFASSWQVTKLRFHDNGTYDVGMDNLTIYDNRSGTGGGYVAVPEPTAISLLAVGLLGLGFFGRLRRRESLNQDL